MTFQTWPLKVDLTLSWGLAPLKASWPKAATIIFSSEVDSTSSSGGGHDLDVGDLDVGDDGMEGDSEYDEEGYLKML